MVNDQKFECFIKRTAYLIKRVHMLNMTLDGKTFVVWDTVQIS